jgi:hypothetical protein
MKVLCHLLTVFLVHNEEAYKLFDGKVIFTMTGLDIT